MKGPKLTFRQWVGWIGFALVFVLTAAAAVWRGDIVRAGLDPQVPFQTYQPPPAPDYGQPRGWALLDARAPGAGEAAVFFVHSTTYEGGRHWNGPIDDPKAEAWLRRVVLPNHAAPFARAGWISAPRYRQASLYTRLTLREDAREARAFAYRDVAAAFDAWIARHPEGPILLVGVEQGGELVERLLHERLGSDPALRRRLVAAYLIDVLAPADRFDRGAPLCSQRRQAGCVMIWAPVAESDGAGARRRLRRALTWDERGRLIGAEGRPLACVNPITGSVEDPASEPRESQGATNATELEWGARPALLNRAVSARCEAGLLRFSLPNSESLRGRRVWTDRWKSMPYNLFYGDIEADVQARLEVWRTARAS